MKAKERLIVALDVKREDRAEELIEMLSPVVDVFKVGIAPFTGYGHTILKKLKEKEKKVFLDLKFHDIPNTVENAARAAAQQGVFMINFHCMGGKDMLEAAVRGAEDGTADSAKKPILLGVTVLTSMSDMELMQLGFGLDVEEKVLEFANLAKEAGLDGVVASAKEAGMIKEKVDQKFVVVTPGVRPEWAAQGDQKRVLTPKQAIEEGADYIVVGRPIIHAEDPVKAAKKIIKEME